MSHLFALVAGAMCKTRCYRLRLRYQHGGCIALLWGAVMTSVCLRLYRFTLGRGYVRLYRFTLGRGYGIKMGAVVSI